MSGVNVNPEDIGEYVKGIFQTIVYKQDNHKRCIDELQEYQAAIIKDNNQLSTGLSSRLMAMSERVYELEQGNAPEKVEVVEDEPVKPVNNPQRAEVVIGLLSNIAIEDVEYINNFINTKGGIVVKKVWGKIYRQIAKD